MGSYELTDEDGNVLHRLYHINNPYNWDRYIGPWSDNSTEWTDEFKAQVPYTVKEDG